MYVRIYYSNEIGRQHQKEAPQDHFEWQMPKPMPATHTHTHTQTHTKTSI